MLNGSITADSGARGLDSAAGTLGASRRGREGDSKLCGSTVTAELEMDGDVVTDFAHEVKACALAKRPPPSWRANVVALAPRNCASLRETVRRMLKEKGAPPAGNGPTLPCWSRWRDYKAPPRSTLLTFDAVVLRDRPDRGQAPGLIGRGIGMRPPSLAAVTVPPGWQDAALIQVYRHTLSPLIGWHCRHLPDCCEYADEAIGPVWACGPALDGAGAAVARHPLGSAGSISCPPRARKIPLVYAVALRAAGRTNAVPRIPVRISPIGSAAARPPGKNCFDRLPAFVGSE